MTVLDTNVVAVVLPTIARDMSASFADVEWVVSTYVLCFAALLLPAGSIADRFGRRKVFLGGIGFFFPPFPPFRGPPGGPGPFFAPRRPRGGGAVFLPPAPSVLLPSFPHLSELALAP